MLSEKDQARAKRKAEGWDRNRERKAREERKRKKEILKEKAKCPIKEMDSRQGSGEQGTTERKGNGNRVLADRERPRRPDREPKVGTSDPAVARVKVTRPTISGNFDALGL